MDDRGRLSCMDTVRSIGEAITRTNSNDISKIKEYLFGEKFGLGAYKGVKVSLDPGMVN